VYIYCVLQPSTIQLLRFPFSFFLLPIYLFALGQTLTINAEHATVIFLILHLLVYPSSNGYNSYMDRDEGPIGGVLKPMQPSKQLFNITIIMDALAIASSLLIDVYFMLGVVIYIIASRLYSYRGVRLKQYPIIGYLVVIIFQGALVFALVFYGSSSTKLLNIPWLPLIAAGLLIGGSYPLTQIYQHEVDKADGVTTISYKLGYRGTFIFSGIIYLIAFALLAAWFFITLQHIQLLVLHIFFAPVLFNFISWAKKVWKDTEAANFKNTMRMNVIASVCTNLAFLTILIIRFFE
jgi:1,4-dihydroxy-2-naphthoate polyprenyltransferase